MHELCTVTINWYKYKDSYNNVLLYMSNSTCIKGALSRESACLVWAVMNYLFVTARGGGGGGGGWERG